MSTAMKHVVIFRGEHERVVGIELANGGTYLLGEDGTLTNEHGTYLGRFEDTFLLEDVPEALPVHHLKDCPRCGGEHPEVLMFRALERPVDDHTHWCLCPANGEPILMHPTGEPEIIEDP